MDFKLCTRKKGESVIVEGADLFVSPIELMIISGALTLKVWDEHSSISDKYAAQKMKEKINDAYEEMEAIWEREVERRDVLEGAGYDEEEFEEPNYYDPALWE